MTFDRFNPAGFTRRALCHCVALLAATVTMSPANAFAITGITIDGAEVNRVASDASLYTCAQRLTPQPTCIVDGTQGVGSRDCADDTALSIPLSIQGLPDANGALEVWAGPTDCTQPGAAHSASTATCWPVAAPPAAAATMVIFVRVADLTASLGSTPPPQTYQSVAAAQACANPNAMQESTVNITFLWFPNGAQDPTVSASYPVHVKLGAPAACTNVSAAPDPSTSSLTLNWVAPAGDTTIAGYDAFADPGSACGDASAIDPTKIGVQIVGATSTQATLSGLLPRTSYATGVAAVDEFGNVGPIATSPSCTTTNDERVQGSCACNAAGEPSRGVGFASLAALAALGLFRARRARRRR